MQAASKEARWNRTPSWSPISEYGPGSEDGIVEDRAPSWSPLSSRDHGSEDEGSTASTPPTIPSPLTLPSTKHASSNRLWRSDEAREFLESLGNYLALGCLTSATQAIDFDDHPPAWREIPQCPLDSSFSATLKDDLSRLIIAGWLRIFTTEGPTCGYTKVFRVYVLPFDAGHRFVDRHNKRLGMALETVIREVDISPDTWNGIRARHAAFGMWAAADPGSLFYMFNKIPSPSPFADDIAALHNREAVADLLDSKTPLPGLKTRLYPYQRRSAALMLQRESESSLHLDPRLEERVAPDGSIFYYGARDLSFLRHPRLYESCKGGILAETMGLGKTVICMSLILATKGHMPKVPAQYEKRLPRLKVGSLADMAIASINRHSIPWKRYFESIEAATGETMTNCLALIRRNAPAYEIPVEPVRWNRNTTLPPPKKLRLASTTVIVVPRNLCSQWQSELHKHVDDRCLSVLVMDGSNKELPGPDQLVQYDVILFSRTRFEQEIKDGADDKGRRLSRLPLTCQCFYIGASRTRDCTCLRPDDLYESPLKHIHFLRIIIDEGHFFSATKSTAAQVANNLVVADHRWVVSGTPAKDLLGVEMDLFSSDKIPMAMNDTSERQNILDQRKSFNTKEDTAGAIKSIGALAGSFLKIRPWAAADGERAATWEEYVYRHEDPKKRTFSGYSKCLRQILESIVVKTQPDDVERDIELPPLTHNIVRLKPSFYDKLTSNLFTFVLTANAVTSERTDADYLFHKNSQKARYQLIHNLRQSAFFWTGFSEADVHAAMEHGTNYLKKDGISCASADRLLLAQCMEEAQTVLESDGWKALSKTHEIGLFVEDWPADTAEHWTFDGSAQPLLTGATQLLEAQSHVNNRITTYEPAEGLAGAGIRALAPLKSAAQESKHAKEGDSPLLIKLGVPSSSVNREVSLKRRPSLSSTTKKPSRQSTLSFKVAKPCESSSGASPAKKKRKVDTQASFDTSSCKAQSNSSDPTEETPTDLPPSSPLRQTRITGTTSAKLSYLISAILTHHATEKMLIFYDGDNIAYYIAQALELLHIPHLIYAKSLTAAQKSSYIVRFDQTPHFRVLLMDVAQAAFGLNLSSASRVFFVNPVCRPAIEAQAIKRAHRIGQTRPVVVETLVLAGSIEEEMFERAKRMTRSEHRDAKVLEDDGGMREIIQGARTLGVGLEEMAGRGAMAPLLVPQALWGRPGWAEWEKGGKRGSEVAGQRVEGAKGKRKMEKLDTAEEEKELGCSYGKHLVEVRIPRPSKRLKLSEGSADNGSAAEEMRTAALSMLSLTDGIVRHGSGGRPSLFGGPAA